MARMLSFRTDDAFADQLVEELAAVGSNLSVFLREAASEKLERDRGRRLAHLSRLVRKESLALNEQLEGTLADGLSG